MKQHFWLFVALLMAVEPAITQTAGSITGHVSDPSGASVAGAKVTLTDVSTNAFRSAITTTSGDYSFPSVPPGNYVLKVEASGFKVEQSNVIQLQVQQSLRQDFTLQIGQLSQSIEVSAQATLVQSENSTLGAVVQTQQIEQLPLNGREYLNLVALAPNTNTLSPPAGQAQSREGGDRSNQSISVGGERIFFDYYTLDGVNNTDPDFNSYVVLPSIDAIQEFKVQTGVYPAEYGHEATQINVMTKSGTNHYHGALFEFLRNDVMDALPYSFTSKVQTKQPFKWNDFGFVLDGPVQIPKIFNGKNRLFFMTNYEALRRRQQSQAVYSVPTAAMESGNFSGYSQTLYQPSSKIPFPNNTIPSSLFDPISLKLLQYYPSGPNVPGAGLANNYVQSQSSPFNRDGFVARMDFVESSKSQWSARYSWGSEDQSSQGLSLAGTKILTNYDQYMVSNTRTFTPTLVNVATYGYTRIFNSIGTLSAFETDEVSAVGIPGLAPGPPVSWGIPNIAFNGDGFSAIGDSNDGPYEINDNNLQFDDNLSWVHGSHTLTFGFEYMRQNFDQVGNQFSRGVFIFQPNATQSPAFTGGDAFAEFLLGDLYQSEVAAGIAQGNFQRNDFAGWADDTWKLTPKLTLSLGLRYELTPPWYDTLGNLFTVDVPLIVGVANAPTNLDPFYVRQGNCTDPYAGIRIRWPQITVVCNNGRLAPALMQTDYTDFAPRVGIAYAPNGKWVFRTGFGIFYVQDIANAVFDMARTTAGVSRVTAITGQPTVTWANAVPPGTTTANIIDPVGYVNAYDHRTGYVMQYLLNVQRQFGDNLLLELGYLGSQSRHLQGFQTVNEAIPGTVGTPQSRVPFPNWGIIQMVWDGGNAHYNAASVSVTKRYSSGLSLMSSYTFSKSIDDTSGIRNQGYDTLYPQNAYCLNPCERGLSAFNVANRFVFSGIYDLPVGRGRSVDVKSPLLNGIVGGWELGGTWTVQSGLPQTLTLGGVDRASAGEGGYNRPNATGISPYLPNPTPSRWFNPAAFVEQPAGTFGNLGRNSVVGPGIFALDFDVHKEFHLFESHQLQFRAEAFNVLNHPVWANPNGNILSPGFGSITGTAIPMRQIQVALKYLF
jgi:hypothetical protein